MKRILFALLFCIGLSGLQAQQMDAVLIAMPDQHIPQLENAWRKDLIDLYQSDKPARLQNIMGGYSTLEKLTENYLKLQVSDRSTIEMKLLPLVNNTNVICVISTVNGPVPDSNIRFYTTEWQPLETADFFTPSDMTVFFRPGADRESFAFQDASMPLDMDLRRYSLSADSLILKEEFTTPLYLGKADQQKIQPYLKESPNVYNWEKFHFK